MLRFLSWQPIKLVTHFPTQQIAMNVSLDMFIQKTNQFNAFETLFKSRSEATESTLKQLDLQAGQPGSSCGYKRAARLLRIVSAFLSRVPDSSKRYPYMTSAPKMCIDWYGKKGIHFLRLLSLTPNGTHLFVVHRISFKQQVQDVSSIC